MYYEHTVILNQLMCQGNLNQLMCQGNILNVSIMKHTGEYNEYKDG